MSSEAQAEKHESIIEALHDCDFPLHSTFLLNRVQKTARRALPIYKQTTRHLTMHDPCIAKCMRKYDFWSAWLYRYQEQELSWTPERQVSQALYQAFQDSWPLEKNRSEHRFLLLGNTRLPAGESDPVMHYRRKPHFGHIP
jgi:tRNA A37 N6-isopentenylltransferase MiaA